MYRSCPRIIRMNGWIEFSCDFPSAVTLDQKMLGNHIVACQCGLSGPNKIHRSMTYDNDTSVRDGVMLPRQQTCRWVQPMTLCVPNGGLSSANICTISQKRKWMKALFGMRNCTVHCIAGALWTSLALVTIQLLLVYSIIFESRHFSIHLLKAPLSKLCSYHLELWSRVADSCCTSRAV